MAFDRRAFNDCMRPYMSGSKTKEQRGFDMCVGAKLCAHKTSSKEEAIRICSEPKPVKSVKTKNGKKGKTCEQDVLMLAKCIVDNIDMNLASNVNSVEMAFANAMMKCKCGE